MDAAFFWHNDSMNRHCCLASAITVFLVTSPAAADDEDNSDSDIAEIVVSARRVANSRPAGTYAVPATLLRYDPTTELQSRGLAEGQSDVTVRGGLFENTGFKAGAVTVIDPQTGHYVAELPIDPASLSLPEIHTGIDNFLQGFNSTVATIAYSLPKIQRGGSILLGAGSDDLNYQSLRLAVVSSADSQKEYGARVSAAFSQGDGDIENGDHEFERYNLQLQRVGESSRSDLIVAYQDKFYGWPGAYTGFPTLAETDHTKTTLVLANHRAERDNGWWEAGAFYRELEDDYDFDRTTQESGAPGSFEHESRVYGAGIQGVVRRGAWDWKYSGQITSDEMVRSTDLVGGNFTSRDYAVLRVVPSIEVIRSDRSSVMLSVGASLDVSSRDSNEVLPVLGATFRSETDDHSQFFSIGYAGTSQVPGYTVLNSPPSGLFGGNADLGRERADQITLSFGRETRDWRAAATVFYRKDDDLVDWTFASSTPSARQANAVDIDVVGVEILFSRSWQSLDLVVAVNYLDKDADYGSATVDASFYALNFARHRATLALRYRLTGRLEFRLDNEYRQQQDNPLRASSASAFLMSAALAWEPPNGRGFGVALSADNLADDDYQQFPGTPAAGRQVSLSAQYAW